jgi:glycosyltransferase involved in cell wall biosynthesis
MKGALLGAAAARLTARPALVHLHDMHPLKPGLRALQRRASRRMAKTIVVSEPIREFAVKEYGVAHDRIEILPNGIRLDSIKASGAARGRVRAELGLDDATPVVGLTARLCPEKGHDYLIRALPALRARCPDAVLVMAGDGPARGDCESVARDLGLEDAVRFLGHRQDVPDLLAAMDVVAVPSVWEEPFGYSALEGIAAGRPVVAFVSEGLRQIVVDGITGFLVPKGDIDRLAASLADVLTNADLARKLGEGGRRHAQIFSIERHVRRLERLYAEALPGRERAYSPEAVVGSQQMRKARRHGLRRAQA